jgi:ATP-dependent protease HslVU (ClpYQ) peptidase subunit
MVESAGQPANGPDNQSKEDVLTCIVGIVAGGDVIIGGDSAGVGGSLIMRRLDPKVFRVGPFLIGYTSSFRMGQLLRFRLQIPERPPELDVYEFMCTRFVDAVRQCFKDGGYAKKDNEQESGGCFLIGYAGRLFEIDSDYQVGEMRDGYDAVGSGTYVALGAFHATAGLTAEERALKALEAAAHFTTTVCAPFVIERLPAAGEGSSDG